MNILSLFDGMSCGMITFKELGIDIDRYVAYEVDKYAIKSATHNFPQIEEKGDVFEADFSQYEGFDFLIGGSPCFTKGHLVLTDKGYKDISEVEIGDMVLTHKNRYKPVVRLYNKKAEIVNLKVKGYPVFETTSNHPFYTITANSEHQFTETPEWTRVDKMTENHLCGQHLHVSSEINDRNLTKLDCYILGTYVVNKHINPLPSHLLRVVGDFIDENTGYKQIPEYIYNLPNELIEEFIDGVMKITEDATFSCEEEQYFSFWVDNPILVLGLQRLIGSFYNTNVTVFPLTEGGYEIIFNNELDKSSSAHVQNGIMWTNVDYVKNTNEIEDVYNIEVADDNSYTVNNCIVHNCTYWSIAQSPDKRETTDSGLGWDLFSQYIRALNEAKPKYFIYENNKSMSKDIRNSIRREFGFEEVCLNSALVSAQNRQRYYWVGKRNEDGTYSRVEISQPEDRGILLKDILYKAVAMQDKSYSYTTRCHAAIIEDTLTKHRHTMAAEPVKYLSEKEMDYMVRDTHGKYNRWGFAQKPDQAEKSPCLTANMRKGVPYNVCCQKVDSPQKPIKVGCMPSPDGTIKNAQGMRVYSIDGKAVNQTAQGGGLGAKTGLYAEPVCVAQRGRYTEDQKTEQHFEVREGGKTNALTTVQKDNNIAEPLIVKEATKKGYTEIEVGDCVDMTQPNSKTRRGRNMKDKCNCLTSSVQYYQYCGKAVSEADGKEHDVYTVKDGKITIKGKEYPIKLIDGQYIIRKLTVDECKKLQTVPDWYEFPVSNTRAYQQLGNGWTIEIIKHLVNACLNN